MGRPSACSRRLSSESSRKRLQAASSASRAAARRSRAGPSAAASVTATVADVPSAGKVVDAGALTTRPTR